MSLSDLAAIGSVISSLAVAMSLIYLGIQTHQAAKHTRALISQGRASRQSEFLGAFSETDRVTAMLEVTTGAPPTPDLVKQAQTQMFFQAAIAAWSEVFEQHQEGLLGNDQFADLRAGIAVVLRRPGSHPFWERWKVARPNTHAAFKVWVDAAISP